MVLLDFELIDQWTLTVCLNFTAGSLRPFCFGPLPAGLSDYPFCFGPVVPLLLAFRMARTWICFT